ncbi:hypothetical protein [Aurantimonas coralicida]|nr:hypothetical protein [Aurantimonas coralicida]MCD1645210.1 hypothetical protein [Aurantimonas coralicida]
MTPSRELRAMAVVALLIPLVSGWIYQRTIEIRADAATAAFASIRSIEH